MANYSLVVNSKFQPFSFERYIQPYQIYGESYKELENQYGELNAKSSVWEEMANEQTDPYAYKMYKTYADDLENQAGQLAREGLNTASRRNMLNMRARYSKEIIPIEQAYAARQKQAEEQQKAILQDPTLMLSRRAATTSLDDYIKNPQLAYESYSGKLITAQVANAASALAKEMQEKPRKWRSILGNSYYETMMQKGFSSGAVLQAIKDNPNAAPQLTRIVEDAINSSGVRNWGDQATITRATDYALQGLWNAVGETQYQTLDDWRARMAEEDKRRAGNEQQKVLNSLAINPLNIYNFRELSKEENQYLNNKKNYSKYFVEKDGKMYMTESGRKEYNKKYISYLGPTGNLASTTNIEMVDSPFKKFMDSIGIRDSKFVIFNNWDGTAGDVWNSYISNNPAAKTSEYDATKATEYDYAIAASQQDDMKDAIMTAARELTLKEVDFDADSGAFVPTGEEITMEDLKNSKYKVTNTRFSPYGATVMIQDDKGNVRRFEMPAGINITNELNRDRALHNAHQWLEIINTGQYPYGNSTRNATEEELIEAQRRYKHAIQQSYLYHSQLGVQNKVKEQEYYPYGY